MARFENRLARHRSGDAGQLRRRGTRRQTGPGKAAAKSGAHERPCGGTIGEAFRPPAGRHFIHNPYQPQVSAQIERAALDENYSR